MKQPKMYVCGFPKAGLHLAEKMVSGMFAKHKFQRPDGKTTSWLGTIAWKIDRTNLKTLDTRLNNVKSGEYVKGHLAHTPGIEGKMSSLNMGCVFGYRDLRDVVISQMHHVLNKNDATVHSGKHQYMQIKKHQGKQDVMLAIIEGIKDYPGILERCDLFAPGLENDWSFTVSFEDLVSRPQLVTSLFYDYCTTLAGAKNIDFDLKMNVINKMQIKMQEKDTTTFRKGEAGGWKAEMSPRVKESFIAHENGWTERMGYGDH